MFETTFAQPAQPPLQLKKKERFVTLREYVLWEAKRDEKYEYHNGKIVKMAYARGPHNEITVNVTAALKAAIRMLTKKYRVFSGDQKIYLPEVNHGVYPDAVVVCEAPEFWDDDTLLLVNPCSLWKCFQKAPRNTTGKASLTYTRPALPSRNTSSSAKTPARWRPATGRSRAYGGKPSSPTPTARSFSNRSAVPSPLRTFTRTLNFQYRLPRNSTSPSFEIGKYKIAHGS